MGVYVSTRVTKHTRISMGPLGWILLGPLVLCWYLLVFEALLVWWMLKLAGLGIAAVCKEIATRRRMATARKRAAARTSQPQSFYSNRR